MPYAKKVSASTRRARYHGRFDQKIADVAQISGTNRTRNVNVVNIQPSGLTSRDFRGFLGRDFMGVMDGCWRSFLSVCACKAVARSVPLYESSAPGAIRAWSHERLLRSVHLLPIHEITPSRDGVDCA